MAIFDLRCEQGHVVEVIQSYDVRLPPCRVCGSPTAKLPSRVSLGCEAAGNGGDLTAAGDTPHT